MLPRSNSGVSVSGLGRTDSGEVSVAGTLLTIDWPALTKNELNSVAISWGESILLPLERNITIAFRFIFRS